MKQAIQIKEACEQDDTTGISGLIKLWFVAEDQLGMSSADYEEDCKLEPIRDNMLKQQNIISHRLIQTRSDQLSHVLDKLRMWESAYGPGINSTIESSGDIYIYMVLSAMDDLRAMIGKQSALSCEDVPGGLSD